MAHGNLIDELALFARKNTPTWRTLADPRLVAEVYRRTRIFGFIEGQLDGYRDINGLLEHILALDATGCNGDVVVAYFVEQDTSARDMNEALNNY